MSRQLSLTVLSVALASLGTLNCSGSGTEEGEAGEVGNNENISQEAQALSGGCSKNQTWGEARGQACVNSPGPSLVTSDAYVSAGSCSTCQFRFVLQLKEDVPNGIDPVVDERIGSYVTQRIAIDNKRVTKNRNYYTFLRLETKVGDNWIRVQTVESPRVTVR